MTSHDMHLPRRLCPSCGGRDDVEPTSHGAAERFYCGPCNLAFTGSDEEWGRWANRRRDRMQRNALEASGLPEAIAGHDA